MKTSLLPLFLAALAALLGLAPTSAWARHPHGPPPGRVLVLNQSGGAVTVTVAGRADRTLSPGQTGDLYSPAGEVYVRATYLQFGAERVLESSKVYVPPSGTATVVLEPEDTARMLVTNDSPFSTQLFVDGKPGAAFTPGESRVVSLRVGTRDLALMAGSRTLERTTRTLRAFEEPRWVVAPPRAGDLLVVNPLPIPIQLVCEKGLVRTVSAYGQTTYTSLGVGDFALTARRVTGEYVDREVSAIRPGATTTWRVDAPRTGFVSLDSDHFLEVEVRIDGKRMAKLQPDGETRIETKVGWHEVVVTDDYGRTVLSTWIEVEPFDVSRLAFGTPSHRRAYDRDSRDGRYDHDDRRSERHGHDDGAVVAQGGSCSMP